MQQALIHITMAREAIFSYQLPLFRWIEDQPFQITCYDFDNHSEALLSDYAVLLLEHSKKILIVIECEAPAPVQQKSVAIKLLNKAVRQKIKEIKLILNGSDPVLEKMGRVLGETHFYTNQSLEEQKALCLQFFK